MKFDQPAYPTVHFSKNIWVRCPNCGSAALVLTELPEYTLPFPTGHKSTCSCANCGFRSAEDEQWHGYWQGFIQSSCSFCGTRFYYSTPPCKQPDDSTTISCDSCDRAADYPLTFYRYRGHEPYDPYFGFELWLQVAIKGQVLWLYNLEHLNYLRAYVSATLREDHHRHKYSLIANLPQWVKSAKNRDLIVKRLNRLEQDFARH